MSTWIPTCAFDFELRATCACCDNVKIHLCKRNGKWCQNPSLSGPWVMREKQSLNDNGSTLILQNCLDKEAMAIRFDFRNPIINKTLKEAFGRYEVTNRINSIDVAHVGLRQMIMVGEFGKQGDLSTFESLKRCSPRMRACLDQNADLYTVLFFIDFQKDEFRVVLLTNITHVATQATEDIRRLQEDAVRALCATKPPMANKSPMATDTTTDTTQRLLDLLEKRDQQIRDGTFRKYIDANRILVTNDLRIDMCTGELVKGAQYASSRPTLFEWRGVVLNSPHAAASRRAVSEHALRALSRQESTLILTNREQVDSWQTSLRDLSHKSLEGTPKRRWCSTAAVLVFAHEDLWPMVWDDFEGPRILVVCVDLLERGPLRRDVMDSCCSPSRRRIGSATSMSLSAKNEALNPHPLWMRWGAVCWDSPVERVLDNNPVALTRFFKIVSCERRYIISAHVDVRCVHELASYSRMLRIPPRDADHQSFDRMSPDVPNAFLTDCFSDPHTHGINDMYDMYDMYDAAERLSDTQSVRLHVGDTQVREVVRKVVLAPAEKKLYDQLTSITACISREADFLVFSSQYYQSEADPLRLVSLPLKMTTHPTSADFASAWRRQKETEGDQRRIEFAEAVFAELNKETKAVCCVCMEPCESTAVFSCMHYTCCRCAKRIFERHCYLDGAIGSLREGSAPCPTCRHKTRIGDIITLGGTFAHEGMFLSSKLTALAEEIQSVISSAQQEAKGLVLLNTSSLRRGAVAGVVRALKSNGVRARKLGNLLGPSDYVPRCFDVEALKNLDVVVADQNDILLTKAQFHHFRHVFLPMHQMKADFVRTILIQMAECGAPSIQVTHFVTKDTGDEEHQMRLMKQLSKALPW